MPVETEQEESTSFFIKRTDAILTEAEIILQPPVVNDALTEQNPDVVLSIRGVTDMDLKIV